MKKYIDRAITLTTIDRGLREKSRRSRQISSPRSAALHGAFTLLELMVVMAVIVILAGLIAPAAGPMLKGNQLNQGAVLLEQQLALPASGLSH